ncbi:hypothetical protein SNEBB_000941 [Seison nebaliae]|nr:hypothetical protein SNEBB_000941 [Seison nebaliae]
MFFSIILLCIIAYLTYRYFNKKSSCVDNLPGPNDGFLSLIYRTRGGLHNYDARQFEKYGYVQKQRFGDTTGIYLGEPEMLKDVYIGKFPDFQDRYRFEAFSSEGVFKYILSNLEGEEWKLARTMMSPVFSTGKIRRTMPKVLEIVTDDLKNTPLNQDIDCRLFSEELTLDLILYCGMGIKLQSSKNSDHPLIKHSRSLFQFNVKDPMIWIGLLLPRLFELIQRIFRFRYFYTPGLRYLEKFIVESLEKRRALGECTSKKGTIDFIDAILEAEKENSELAKMPSEYTVAQPFIFLLAGFDTVAGVISFALTNLSLYPHYQERVRDEIEEIRSKLGEGEELFAYDNLKNMTFLKMFIDESIRLFPALIRNSRKCTRSTHLDMPDGRKLFVEKGTQIIIPVYALHRCERFWGKDANEFRPERFEEDFEKIVYSPFGHGNRNCIAQRFAELEVVLVIGYIVSKFKILPSDKLTLPLKLGNNLLPRAENGLWIKLEELKK